MSEPPIHTGVDHVHAHPRHVGYRPLDLILALLAVFISAVSLYVAIDHGRTEQKLVQANAQLVQANSWPFLQVDDQFSTSSPTQIALVNAGIGPAKLESLQVLFHGQPVEDFYTLLKLCCGLSSNANDRKAQMPGGFAIYDAENQVLRPGERRLLMVVPATPTQHEISDRFLKASTDIQYRACYCSVFDQCWTSDLMTLKPQTAAACPVGMPGFNQNAR